MFPNVNFYSAVSDRVSETGSLATRRSRNTKKQERRKYLLKEGSANEDLALINAIKEIMLMYNKAQEEVAVLLRSLYNIEMIDNAFHLQNEFENFSQTVKKKVDEVWPKREQTNFISNEMRSILERYRLHDGECN